MNPMFRIAKFIIKIILVLFLWVLKESFYDQSLLPALYYTAVVKSMLHFLIYWLTVNIIIRFAQFVYRKRKRMGDRYSDNVIGGLQNIYYILSVIGLVIMFIGFFGIEFNKLLTALSIVAAAIAIISKEIIADILCGISITFSRDIAIGDYVKIGEAKGRVIDINIHKIVLHNDDDDIIYISNSKAYYDNIVNYTQKEIRKYNVEFSIPVYPQRKLNEIDNQLKEVLSNFEEYLEPGQNKLRISALAKDEVRFKFQFKLNQINPQVADQIKSKIMEHVLGQLYNRA